MLGVGYLLGKVAVGSFKLGAFTGTLLAGVLVGQLGVKVSSDGERFFIERLRHGGDLFDPQPSVALCLGDTIAVSGRRQVLAERLIPIARWSQSRRRMAL